MKYFVLAVLISICRAQSDGSYEYPAPPISIGTPPNKPNNQFQTPNRPANQFNSDFSNSKQFINGDDGGGGGGGGGVGGSDQDIDIQKYLYFYAAPEEAETFEQRVVVPQQQSKKNVKILFIKAPTFTSSSHVEIPAAPQIEEKTLIYVLVKKPDDQEPIVIPTPPPSNTIKPEVYFIKYKTQKEAEEAIANIQRGANSDSTSIIANNLGDDQQFIDTIGKDINTNSDSNVHYISSGGGDGYNSQRIPHRSYGPPSKQPRPYIKPSKNKPSRTYLPPGSRSRS